MNWEAMGRVPDIEKDMPRVDGYLLAPHCLPESRLVEMETKWKDWMETHPKSTWPGWLTDSIAIAKHKRVKT